MNKRLKGKRHRPIVWQELNAHQLVHEVIQDSARTLLMQGIQVNVDVPRTATVTADQELLRRALRELVQGAIASMPRGGELAVTAWFDETRLELEIADSRPQTLQRDRPGEARDHLPESVRQAADAHGGDLTVVNCPEGGLAVTMRIPTRAVRAAA